MRPVRHDVAVYATRARRLRDILNYIESENPAAANRARRAIFNTLNQIAERPYLGIRNARATHLRSRLVGRYPFRIHYLVESATIWIVHIRHSARRPWNPGED